MADGDGAAVHVDAGALELELFFDGEILRAERLGDIEARDVLLLKARGPEYGANRRHGPDAHDLRRYSDARARDDAREWTQAVSPDVAARGDQHARRAIDDGGAVAARLHAVLAEGGP